MRRQEAEKVKVDGLATSSGVQQARTTAGVDGLLSGATGVEGNMGWTMAHGSWWGPAKVSMPASPLQVHLRRRRGREALAVSPPPAPSATPLYPHAPVVLRLRVGHRQAGLHDERRLNAVRDVGLSRLAALVLVRLSRELHRRQHRRQLQEAAAGATAGRAAAQG